MIDRIVAGGIPDIQRVSVDRILKLGRRQPVVIIERQLIMILSSVFFVRDRDDRD